MRGYTENLDETMKKYFDLLSDDVPEFIYDYINTPEMQKQAKISVSCGTIYSKTHKQIWYSSLDHSIAVALIIWNFTKNKKQTLAGLFHDIATPVFKHSIDFMNGDYEKQESTEELTTKILRESKEIMTLLDRDGIKLEEIDDYHIYPIADNDTPKLAADRLEYTMSNALGATEELWSIEDVKEIYQNIEVQRNEEGIEELGFKDKEIAIKFAKMASLLSIMYRRPKTVYAMQFLADIMKTMSENDLITTEDLYKLSEKEVIEKIENCTICDISEKFKKWRNATEVKESENPVDEKYCVKVKSKVRYINPLVNIENQYIRLSEISEEVRKAIDNAKNYKTNYVYIEEI